MSKTEILSSEEIDKLLTAISNGEVDNEEMAETGDNRKVKIYDFKRPDKFSKNQIRTISMIHETFARLVTTGLSAQLRALAHIHVTSVDQLTYEEFIRSIPNPTTLSVINMEPLKGNAVLEIDPSITFAIIEKLFGGRPEGLAKITRELTEIESAVMEGVIVRMLGNFREAWSYVTDIRPRLQRIEVNPQFAQIVPPSDMAVLVTFETKIGEVEGMTNLCIPYYTLENIIGKLDDNILIPQRKPEISSIHNMNSLQIPLKFELTANSEHYSINEILNIKKGDLIELNTDNINLEINDLEMTQINSIGINKKEIIINYPLYNSIFREANSSRDINGLDQINQEAKNKNYIDKEFFNNEINKIKDFVRDETFFVINSIQTEVGKINQEKSKEDTENIENNLQSKTFDFISRTDPEYLLNFIKEEHPQTIALILSYLDTDKSSTILEALPQEIQSDVAKRIAIIDGISPDVIREVERILEKRLSTIPSDDFTFTGGIDIVVDILNGVSSSTERTIIETLEEEDPDLAEEIKRRMFVFEDIVHLSDRDIQKVIREIDTTELAISLKGVKSEVQDKIFRNMSKRALMVFKEDMDFMGPLRLKDIDEAQKKIVDIIKKLEDNGDIVITRAGEDELVE